MRQGEVQVTALVLAGKRDGTLDPLAAEAGVGHKCVVPVAGRPMIAHVLDALANSAIVDAIIVSIDDPGAIEALPEVRDLRDAGRLRLVPSRRNIVDSVLAAADAASFPMLVTTADNVLLTPEAIVELAEGARTGGADAAVAFTARESVLAAHPDGQRRFYRFSDGSYSNCNSYWLAHRQALAAAESFRSGGQFAKHPLRIVGAFGFLNLVRFRFGIGTLAAAFARFSRRLGLRIRPVILRDGAIAIDVDNARTRGVAEGLLLERSPVRQARTLIASD